MPVENGVVLVLNADVPCVVPHDLRTRAPRTHEQRAESGSRRNERPRSGMTLIVVEVIERVPVGPRLVALVGGAALITLALGIGANTAMFSLLILSTSLPPGVSLSRAPAMPKPSFGNS